MNAKRLLKWVGIVLCIGAFAYSVLIVAFLACYHYTSAKMEWVLGGDVTRSEIDANKGLLFSGEVEPSSLGGYRSVFQELVDDPNNVLVYYSLVIVGFTIIYGEAGTVLAVIDNGLDG